MRWAELKFILIWSNKRDFLNNIQFPSFQIAVLKSHLKIMRHKDEKYINNNEQKNSSVYLMSTLLKANEYFYIII